MLRDLLDTGVDFGWESSFLNIKYERMYFYYKIIIYIAK